MRKLLLALLLLLPLSLAAQHRHIPYLGFARLDRNRIQYPSGESPDFDRFLRKMDTTSASCTSAARTSRAGPGPSSCAAT